MGNIDTQTLTQIGFFIAIILATLLIAWVFRRLYSKFIVKSTAIVLNDPTNYKFIGHLLSALIYVLGFSFAVYSVPALKAMSTSLLAGAGIVAVAVGFASQAALSNIISGFFIIIFKPYRVNDRLTLRNNLAGIVEDITLRHTVIRDFENKRIIIPNSIISDEVLINSDIVDGKICKWIDIQISYDSDLLLAKSIIRDEIINHQFHIDPRNEEQITNGDDMAPVRVVQHTESGMLLRGWAWAENAASAFQMGCDLLESIKLRFDKEGIEIPYPHRTIVQKSNN
ncbi:MAG: mechanosensitive ion channel family protein [Bacteroidota bacterium]